MADDDTINHPAHYTFSDIEPIDAIEAWMLNFHTGNAVKYIARHRHKADPLADLKKARWYLDREIERIEKANDESAAGVLRAGSRSAFTIR